MKLRFWAAASLAFFISAAPAVAQLGPKDAANGPATELERVKVGQPAPDFSLDNVEGKPVALSDFRDKKSVVLVFYRGYW
jgi:cytochrome oxidase Cu insertion factor (SCO1/SenC/PrrC family)